MKKSQKRSSIYSRRCRVVSAVSLIDTMTFDQIVSNTAYSRNEVAYHLALLVRKGRVIRNNEKGVNTYSIRESFNSPRIMRSFNQFMYGCDNIAHSSIHGYFDPSSRRGRSLMDP